MVSSPRVRPQKKIKRTDSEGFQGLQAIILTLMGHGEPKIADSRGTPVVTGSHAVFRFPYKADRNIFSMTVYGAWAVRQTSPYVLSSLCKGWTGRMARKRREVGESNMKGLVPRFTGSQVPAILMHFHVDTGELPRLGEQLTTLVVN